MSLKQRINDDMKSAMKARDSARLSAIRMLLAAIRQREIDDQVDLDDREVERVVEKAIKQRRDAARQYAAAARADLADKERFEIEVLGSYLPAQLDDEAIETAIMAAIESSGASGPADLGKLMTLLKGQLTGRADMANVSARARRALAPR